MTDKNELPPPEQEPEPLNTDAVAEAVKNLRAVCDNARTNFRPPGLLLDEIDQAVKGIEAALKPAE